MILRYYQNLPEMVKEEDGKHEESPSRCRDSNVEHLGYDS
jgi:hypothetical protein